MATDPFDLYNVRVIAQQNSSLFAIVGERVIGGTVSRARVQHEKLLHQGVPDAVQDDGDDLEERRVAEGAVNAAATVNPLSVLDAYFVKDDDDDDGDAGIHTDDDEAAAEAGGTDPRQPPRANADDDDDEASEEEDDNDDARRDAVSDVIAFTIADVLVVEDHTPSKLISAFKWAAFAVVRIRPRFSDGQLIATHAEPAHIPVGTVFSSPVPAQIAAQLRVGRSYSDHAYRPVDVVVALRSCGSLYSRRLEDAVTKFLARQWTSLQTCEHPEVQDAIANTRTHPLFVKQRNAFQSQVQNNVFRCLLHALGLNFAHGLEHRAFVLAVARRSIMHRMRRAGDADASEPSSLTNMSREKAAIKRAVMAMFAEASDASATNDAEINRAIGDLLNLAAYIFNQPFSRIKPGQYFLRYIKPGTLDTWKKARKSYFSMLAASAADDLNDDADDDDDADDGRSERIEQEAVAWIRGIDKLTFAALSAPPRRLIPSLTDTVLFPKVAKIVTTMMPFPKDVAACVPELKSKCDAAEKAILSAFVAQCHSVLSSARAKTGEATDVPTVNVDEDAEDEDEDDNNAEDEHAEADRTATAAPPLSYAVTREDSAAIDAYLRAVFNSMSILAMCIATLVPFLPRNHYLASTVHPMTSPSVWHRQGGPMRFVAKLAPEILVTARHDMLGVWMQPSRSGIAMHSTVAALHALDGARKARTCLLGLRVAMCNLLPEQAAVRAQAERACTATSGVQRKMELDSLIGRLVALESKPVLNCGNILALLGSDCDPKELLDRHLDAMGLPEQVLPGPAAVAHASLQLDTGKWPSACPDAKSNFALFVALRCLDQQSHLRIARALFLQRRAVSTTSAVAVAALGPLRAGSIVLPCLDGNAGPIHLPLKVTVPATAFAARDARDAWAKQLFSQLPEQGVDGLAFTDGKVLLDCKERGFRIGSDPFAVADAIDEGSGGGSSNNGSTTLWQIQRDSFFAWSEVAKRWLSSSSSSSPHLIDVTNEATISDAKQYATTVAAKAMAHANGRECTVLIARGLLPESGPIWQTMQAKTNNKIRCFPVGMLARVEKLVAPVVIAGFELLAFDELQTLGTLPPSTRCVLIGSSLWGGWHRPVARSSARALWDMLSKAKAASPATKAAGTTPLQDMMREMLAMALAVREEDGHDTEPERGDEDAMDVTAASVTDATTAGGDAVLDRISAWLRDLPSPPSTDAASSHAGTASIAVRFVDVVWGGQEVLAAFNGDAQRIRVHGLALPMLLKAIGATAPLLRDHAQNLMRACELRFDTRVIGNGNEAGGGGGGGGDPMQPRCATEALANAICTEHARLWQSAFHERTVVTLRLQPFAACPPNQLARALLHLPRTKTVLSTDDTGVASLQKQEDLIAAYVKYWRDPSRGTSMDQGIELCLGHLLQ